MAERDRHDSKWAVVKSKYPDLDCATEKFAHSYFGGQVHIERGKQIKAKRLYNRLDKIKGYTDFENSNEDLLKFIDVTVRGKSNR